MKKLATIVMLLGAVAARATTPPPCADSNVIVSSGSTTLSTTLGARCTPVGPYVCTHGGMTAWGFDLISPCTTNFVSYAVQTPDLSQAHHYDLGLYCIAGPCVSPLGSPQDLCIAYRIPGWPYFQQFGGGGGGIDIPLSDVGHNNRVSIFTLLAPSWSLRVGGRYRLLQHLSSVCNSLRRRRPWVDV